MPIYKAGLIFSTAVILTISSSNSFGAPRDPFYDVDEILVTSVVSRASDVDPWLSEETVTSWAGEAFMRDSDLEPVTIRIIDLDDLYRLTVGRKLSVVFTISLDSCDRCDRDERLIAIHAQLKSGSTGGFAFPGPPPRAVLLNTNEPELQDHVMERLKAIVDWVSSAVTHSRPQNGG